MKIRITQEDIDEGVRQNWSNCMISVAIGRQIRTAVNIEVTQQVIRWSDREQRKRYWFLTPQRARRYVIEYDKGREIKPFDVDLGEPIRVMPLRLGEPLHPRRKVGGRVAVPLKTKLHAPTRLFGERVLS